MKLAVSQIAWAPEDEQAALAVLQSAGFTGLEIAPPRVAGPQPYNHPEKAAEFARCAKETFGLALCSMQSIWFGQSGNMFGPERQALLAYTKKAVLFAQAGGMGNLVFGNPKARVLAQGQSGEEAIPFFKEIGDFAAAHNTVLALEANPPVYGTNFMNTTAQAFATARQAASAGCRVNLDYGTIVTNNEDVDDLQGRVGEINHVHISEPQLAPLQKREGHARLARLLQAEGYAGYVSIEMKAQPLETLRRAVAYVAEVFG